MAVLEGNWVDPFWPKNTPEGEMQKTKAEIPADQTSGGNHTAT